MSDEVKTGTENQKVETPAGTETKAAPQGMPATDARSLMVDESAHATYSNLCRITGTPEEVLMDFAMNPNSFGPVLDERV